MTITLASAPPLESPRRDVFRPQWLPINGPLRDHVLALMAVEVDPLHSAAMTLKIAPHDSLMLTVQFGRGADGVDQKGSLGDNTWLTGIRQWTGTFAPAGDCVTLFALLTPLGAVHLLEGQPLDAVPRIRAQVADVLDRQVTRHLETAIVRAPSLDVRLRAFGAWLEQRATRPRAVAHAALRAGRAAMQTCLDPSIEVETLARDERITRRQLERDFARWIGTSPRHLAQVARLQSVSRHAARGWSLAHVAAEAGYADQAHMSRAVRALTGVTPRRFVQAASTPMSSAFRAATGGRTVYI